MQQAVSSQQCGPRYGSILEFQTDTIAITGQPLTINHLTASRVSIQRRNAEPVAGLPCLSGEDACAVSADVIGEGAFFCICIGGRIFRQLEAHYDDDRQPPFHSATGFVLQKFAQIQAGQIVKFLWHRDLSLKTLHLTLCVQSKALRLDEVLGP